MQTMKDLSSLPLPSLAELQTVMPNAIEAIRRDLNTTIKEQGMRAALEKMNDLLPLHLSCLKEAEEKMLRDGEGHHYISSVNRNFAYLTGLRTYLTELVELCQGRQSELPEDLAGETDEVITLIQMAEANVAFQMKAVLKRVKSVVETKAADWQMFWSPARGFYLDKPFPFSL